jgi:hypothetical protein
VQDPETGELIPKHLYYREKVQTHIVMPDTPEYHSPVTGELVSGRVARMRDLKKHGCRPYETGEREHYLKTKDRDWEERTSRQLDRVLAKIAHQFDIRD